MVGGKVVAGSAKKQISRLTSLSIQLPTPTQQPVEPGATTNSQRVIRIQETKLHGGVSSGLKGGRWICVPKLRKLAQAWNVQLA